MNKYYKPDFEEFHIGFEYEIFCLTHWEKKKISYSQFTTDGIDLGEFSEIRVKYLDKEDIESLGFIQTIRDQYYKDDFKLLIDNDLFVQIIKDDDFVFQGTIKNKSELKKILQQVYAL